MLIPRNGQGAGKTLILQFLDKKATQEDTCLVLRTLNLGLNGEARNLPRGLGGPLVEAMCIRSHRFSYGSENPSNSLISFASYVLTKNKSHRAS
jgi:hypothetical protein